MANAKAEARGSIIAIGGDKMKMNAFVNTESLNGIIVSIYSIRGDQESLKESERYKEAWRLCRAFKGYPVPFMGGEKILLLGKGEEKVSSGNLIGALEKVVPLDMSDPAMRSAMAEITRQAINRRMKSKGYITETGAIIPKSPRITPLGNGEPVLVYENGAKFQVEGLSGGHLIVWIDPKVRIKQDALHYIEWRTKNKTKGEIEQELTGIQVFLAPFNQKGAIDSLDWENTPSTKTFECPPEMKERIGKDMITIQDYWRYKHFVTVKADESPIINVKLKGRNTAVGYPASTVFFSTKGKSYPKSVRDSFTMPSIRRVTKTENMAKMMLGGPLEINGKEIPFETKMADEDDLKNIGKMVSTGHVEKPLLSMGKNKTASAPKEISKYGPYSGARYIPVYYLLPPASELDVKQLHSQLQKFNSSLKLGELEKIGHSHVHTSASFPTRNDYWDGARNAGFEIDKYMKTCDEPSIKSGKPVLISILPNKDSETYAGGKQGAHSDNHSIQNMTLRTAREIISGRSGMFYAQNTLMQVYLKSLGKGEAPWILEKPAGGIDGTAYLGYDVSRRQEHEYGSKKEAAATISMVDSQGRNLLNKLHTSQSGETLDRLTANRMVFEVTGEAHRTFMDRDQIFRRLVIFKDGVIRNNEKENIKAGVSQAINDMIPKATMPDEVEVDLIAVVKSGIERLYENSGYNPEDGVYAIFYDNVAIVATSNLGKRSGSVTVQTTRLEPMFKAMETGMLDGSEIDIKRIIHEFSDLCNLDWASLWKQPKYPIVLRLVQRLGEQYTLDISDPSYLPL